MATYKDFKKLIQNSELYPTTADLIYRHHFTHNEVDIILKQKLDDHEFIKLPLISSEDIPLHYYNDERLFSLFEGSQQLIDNANIPEMSDVRDEELIHGFMFSEIESSLSIEGVRSTRAKIESINTTDYEDLTSINDIIVKNMIKGYNFVQDKDITEENIHALYKILSKGGLDEDHQLQDGQYYRHDAVDIIGNNEVVVDQGVPYQILPERMNKLVAYIHHPRTYEEHLVVPHIIHYYFIYLHPYFDYNGRMARVLSYWYTMQYVPLFSLIFVSEAINNIHNKRQYYNAITNARKTNNDITYFLEHLGSILLQYSKVYINYYKILYTLKGNGQSINRSSEVALKNVLAMPQHGDGYFDWKDYKEFSHDDVSKVQYLKILNTLVDVNVLTVKIHKKAKLFKLNTKKWDIFQ